jgi:hypothetical protein
VISIIAISLAVGCIAYVVGSAMAVIKFENEAVKQGRADWVPDEDGGPKLKWRKEQ